MGESHFHRCGCPERGAKHAPRDATWITWAPGKFMENHGDVEGPKRTGSLPSGELTVCY